MSKEKTIEHIEGIKECATYLLFNLTHGIIPFGFACVKIIEGCDKALKELED